MPSIDDFKSSVSLGNGLALANRYRIQFDFPADVTSEEWGNPNTARQFDMLCDSAVIPGRNISTIDYQAHKQTYKIANGYSFDEATFSFLLTNDYMVKYVFDKWAQSVIDFKNYRAMYRQQYVADIDIIQMDKNDNAIYGSRLIGAYPINISPIALENSAENTVQRLTVSMAYEDFEMIENLEMNITAT